MLQEVRLVFCDLDEILDLLHVELEACWVLNEAFEVGIDELLRALLLLFAETLLLSFDCCIAIVQLCFFP